jgi:hypothetical protein
MGAGDDSAHSQNEKLDVRNYIEGVSINMPYILLNFLILVNTLNKCILFQTKLLAAYLYEVSKIKN